MTYPFEIEKSVQFGCSNVWKQSPQIDHLDSVIPFLSRFNSNSSSSSTCFGSHSPSRGTNFDFVEHVLLFHLWEHQFLSCIWLIWRNGIGREESSLPWKKAIWVFLFFLVGNVPFLWSIFDSFNVHGGDLFWQIIILIQQCHLFSTKLLLLWKQDTNDIEQVAFDQEYKWHWLSILLKISASTISHCLSSNLFKVHLF